MAGHTQPPRNKRSSSAADDADESQHFLDTDELQLALRYMQLRCCGCSPPAGAGPTVVRKSKQVKRQTKRTGQKANHPKTGAAAAAATGPGARPPLLRILCLHGFAQNGQSFRQKTGSLRKAVKKLAHFEFVDAPHELVDQQQRGWYLPLPAAAASVPSTSMEFFEDDSVGVEKLSWTRPLDEETWNCSFAYLEKVFTERGPFDGVFGFSQGAAMAAALCAHCCCTENSGAEKIRRSAIQFRFACFFSGFVPAHGLVVGDGGNSDSLDGYCGDGGGSSSSSVQGLDQFRSFHCYGLNDKIIAPERSRHLASAEFGITDNVNNHKSPASLVSISPPNNKYSRVVSHAGGHLVPSGKPVRDALKAFLREQQKEQCVE